MWCDRSTRRVSLDLRVCGHVVRVKHDDTQRSTLCSHHFQPLGCLCLLSQRHVLRKAERIPPRVGSPCWSPVHSQSVTFALPRGNAFFQVFDFVCLSFFFEEKCEGQDALKGTRHEVLHRILWRDSSGSHQHFWCCSLTADVCECLEPVEAAPPSFAISFCSVHQCSMRLFSTAVFSSCPPRSSGHQCL